MDEDIAIYAVVFSAAVMSLVLIFSMAARFHWFAESLG